MKVIPFLLAALAGLALSGCALSPGPTVSEQTKPNTFEVVFDFDRATITPASAEILREVAASAKNENSAAITLIVHTDTGSGDEAHRRALTARRAETVTAELIKDGVPAGKITSIAGSQGNPLTTNDGMHEPQNRRTEIILR
jgi:outer membrane protein OmpA-like peptidoglycan-associated protein